MTQEITVNIDIDSMVIDDLQVLESGEGIHALIVRCASDVCIDGLPIPVGEVPLRYLSDIGAAIGEAIKGLSNPNA